MIAHEVDHHVQTLLGVSQQMQAARQRGAQMEGDNGLLVRQELQADCFAGVWAYHAQQRHDWLEEGDLEQALNAANAIVFSSRARVAWCRMPSPTAPRRNG